MKFKKNRIVFISIFIVFLSGMLMFYFWYESKCVKFQDKNMAVQTLYLVDSGRGKVLKKGSRTDHKHLYDRSRRKIYNA